MEQYIDACELIKDTERELRKLRKQRETIETDMVKASLPEFPYTQTTVKIQGVAYTSDHGRLERTERLLEERKTNAQAIKLQVEEWLNTIPSRMQRIIKYKIFEQLTWEETAARIGRKATGDNLKKEYQRFMDSI